MPIHLNATTAPNSSRCHRAISITRREFLAGAAAAGVASLVEPSRLLAGEERPTIWAFVSDTHISHDPTEKVRGHNMTDNLKRVVEEVLAAKPDRVLFNGDMAYKKGRPEDYEAFLEIIDPLRERKTQLHFTLGNHDRRENFITSIEDSGASPAHSSFSQNSFARKPASHETRGRYPYASAQALLGKREPTARAGRVPAHGHRARQGPRGYLQ